MSVLGFDPATWIIVAVALMLAAVIFVRDLRKGLPRRVSYPKGLRLASAGALVVGLIGVANFVIWHFTALGLSVKQIAILAALPALIVSYYGMSYRASH